MPMGARLARARGGGGWRLGAARQPEPVHLADHRIAGDAAKLRSDLARRQSIRPEFLQRFDALIGPGHASNSSPVAAAEEVQTESHSGPGQRPVGPTHTRATDLRYDLSAARSVVFDDGKATIWRESGARVRAACFHMFCPRRPMRPHLSANLCSALTFAAVAVASSVMLTADHAAIQYRVVPPGEAAHFVSTDCRLDDE